MPPNCPTNAYTRYQEDILAITTWLAHVSHSCGWQPPQASKTPSTAKSKTLLAKIPRLKGKDRKQAKEASRSAPPKPEPTQHGSNVRHAVTADDLLAMVGLVTKVKKGKTKFPVPVQRALESAIGQRKKCAEWLRITDSRRKYETFGLANQKIIDVLEKVGSLLRAALKVDGPAGDMSSAQAISGEPDSMNNYFSTLNLDKSQEDKEDLPTLQDILELLAPSPGATQTNTPSSLRYELATDPETELAFQVFCLFDDLHILRGEVQKAWQSYKAATMTLVTATILTTIAVQFVGQLENELIAANPESIKPSQSYHDLTSTIFHSEHLNQKLNPDERGPTSDMEITPVMDFVYLTTGRTLSRISQQQNILAKVQYPAPVFPFSIDYTSQPELLGRSDLKRIQKEDELICQLVLDFTLIDAYKENEADYRKFDKTSELQLHILPTFDDIFTDAMESVWKSGEVTVRSVFGTRVLLDIMNICSDFDGERALRDQGQRQHELFEFYVDDDGVFDMRSGFRWLTKDVHLVKEIYDRITRHMIHHGFADFRSAILKQSDGAAPKADDAEKASQEQIIKQKLSEALRKRTEEHAKKWGVDLVQPNQDAKLYLNRNPLFCGTLLLSQTVSIEAASIALANHHLSILAVAHLYNALRKMDLIDIVWPDMERVIELHPGPIFADDIPSTPEEMRTRIFFRLGTDRTFTRVTVDETTLAKRNMLTSPATELILQFFRSDYSFESTLLQVQETIHSTQQHPPNPTKPCNNPTLSQSMEYLKTLATAALSETQLPYLGLTKLCIYYLQHVRTALLANNCIVPPRTNPQDSNDQSLVFMAADILQNNSTANNKASKKKTPGKQLEIAAGEFSKMWEYLESERFVRDRGLYFLDGEGGVRDEGHVRGW